MDIPKDVKQEVIKQLRNAHNIGKIVWIEHLGRDYWIVHRTYKWQYDVLKKEADDAGHFNALAGEVLK